jgi:hypothetical protein
MKLIIKFYNNLKLKPSYKFFFNLFFIKNISSYIIKQLQYISLFISLSKILKIKFFKFNYSLYMYIIWYFILINIIIQFIIFII